jgi:DNA-binding FadR family transcriptional regulator
MVKSGRGPGGAPIVTRPHLHEQVANDLRAKIHSGEYPPGSKLPSTSELCDIYGVSETVVRYAMHTLRLEGLIEGQQGKGVYVIEQGSPSDR